MRVRVPLMIQDPLTSRYKGMRLVEEFFADQEPFYLDGPVTERLAVLDFDPDTGKLLPGATFMPPNSRRKLGRYKIPERNGEFDINAPAFLQTSAFGTVLRTMYMYEEMDAMGRKLRWAFDAPQLLIIPRAGQMANAYYERDSHSLQFFFFPVSGSQMIYTCLSRDIVAHETGHAILDGIAPDLYNAITPQSLGLHEAIADLTALLMAFRSHNLRETVLRQTGGSIENTTAFSSVAEEFGNALDSQGHAGYLRSLLNERTLDANDTSTDRYGNPNRVPRNQPHALSEVLTGALYRTMVNLHNKRKAQYEQEDGLSPAAAGKALWVASEQFKRMILRALDYLPPGEISFADYGRAIIAADQALFPDDGEAREWLRAEFLKRHMVGSDAELEVRTNWSHPAVSDLDLQTLVESDWAAYAFANQNRELLRIPPEVPFEVRPRLDVTKTVWGDQAKRRECILKISWDVEEPNRLPRPFPLRRQITHGTMLAIDWESHQIRALLTTDPTEAQMEDRDRMLSHLYQEDALALTHQAVGPDGRPVRDAILVEATNRLMRVTGTARTLHILRGM